MAKANVGAAVLVIFSLVCFADVAANRRIPRQSADCRHAGVLGTCIPLRQCSIYMQELNNARQRTRHISWATITRLQRLGCGFEGIEPKVCCPLDFVQKTPSAPPDVTRHPRLDLVNSKSCGPLGDNKIFGGNKAELFEFPWMANIGYIEDGEILNSSCGGSLINDRYILTAAHCIPPPAITPTIQIAYVRLGELNMLTDPDCMDLDECADRAIDVLVETAVRHPKYDAKTHHNDIALIRLKNSVLFSDSVKPICLPINPTQNIDLTRKKVVVTGWGLDESGEASPHLLRVALPVIANVDCNATYHNLVQNNPVEIVPSQMCAGDTGFDSCNGDSGGPLQYPATVAGFSRMMQYGVVSIGTLDCGVGTPGVYTRVAFYVDWILDQIRI